MCGPRLTLAVSCGWVHVSCGWVHLSLGLGTTSTPAPPEEAGAAPGGGRGGGAASPWSSGWELTLEAPPSPEDQVSNCGPGTEFQPSQPRLTWWSCWGLSRGLASLALSPIPF